MHESPCWDQEVSIVSKTSSTLARVPTTYRFLILLSFLLFIFNRRLLGIRYFLCDILLHIFYLLNKFLFFFIFGITSFNFSFPTTPVNKIHEYSERLQFDTLSGSIFLQELSFLVNFYILQVNFSLSFTAFKKLTNLLLRLCCCNFYPKQSLRQSIITWVCLAHMFM